ncbi:hypothetical protein B484DRAFT_410594 [Ochromonadaceae sp. CCMP2298]|nr:hypothetical protein B484DRAFT_410594 [Ochromonadaceae sp. CCMP2298]
MTPAQLAAFVPILRRTGKLAPIYGRACGECYHYPDLVSAMPAKHSEFTQYHKVYIHVSHEYIDMCKGTEYFLFGGEDRGVSQHAGVRG